MFMNNTAKKYILIAEDDRFYGNMFETKLQKEGFDVLVCDNGKNLLAAVSSRKPDLILLDLIMPVMDGFETLKELKANSGSRDIPVVVLSNLGQDEDIERAKKEGAVDYLVKSNLSIQEMVQKVKDQTE